MLSKLIDIISSTEFWSALFGAGAAFMLEALRRHQDRRNERLATGDHAIFVLSQMYTTLTNLHNQAFVDRAQFVRKAMKREPHFFEFVPTTLYWDRADNLKLSELRFLLRTYEPDILNRLAAADRAFFNLLDALEQRNELHTQFQARTNAVLPPDQPVSIQAARAAVGADLWMQLDQLTKFMVEDLPKSAELMLTVMKQLRVVLRHEFPTAAVPSFEPVDRGQEFDMVKQPALWRRMVRSVTDVLSRNRKPKALK